LSEPSWQSLNPIPVSLGHATDYDAAHGVRTRAVTDSSAYRKSD